MNLKIVNLLLLGGAFAVAASASDKDLPLAAGDLTSLSSFLAVLALFAMGTYVWCQRNTQQSQNEWAPLAALLDADLSNWRVGLRGTYKNIPVYARIEPASTNSDYLSPTAARYSDSKYFFTLTLQLPFQDASRWRIAYQPKRLEQRSGEWQATSDTSGRTMRELASAGVTDLFSEWNRFTVVRCNAAKGELTLRYPATHSLYCPTRDELENEINLLCRIAGIWQNVTRTNLAA